MTLPITSKTVFMQRVADHVGRGYAHYTSGRIPQNRWPVLCRKFADLYLIGLGKDARYRRKQLGLGNAVLLGWQDGEDVGWCLLVTSGDHPAHTLETLQDAVLSPVTVTGYELVRTPRAGQSKPAWSWRMAAETYQAWRDRILVAVRHENMPACASLWESLYQSPGFALIRSQVGKLVAFFKAEWRRSRKSEFPFAPRPLYYVRRLRVRAVSQRKAQP